jgi:hypothetical protein
MMKVDVYALTIIVLLTIVALALARYLVGN